MPTWSWAVAGVFRVTRKRHQRVASKRADMFFGFLVGAMDFGM